MMPWDRRRKIVPVQNMGRSSTRILIAAPGHVGATTHTKLTSGRPIQWRDEQMRKHGQTGQRQDDRGGGSGAIGQRLADLFQVNAAPAFIVRKLGVTKMAVTEIRADDPVLGLTPPVPTEDAFLLSLMFRGLDNHEAWESERPCPRHSIAAGQFIIRDLKREQAALIEQPHHSLQLYLPRAALDEIADDAEVSRIGELRYRPGVPFSDPVVWHLGSCLLPALEHSEQANRLFLEHVTLALGIHVAHTYGDLKPLSKTHKGGLTGWQEKRAKELLSANLSGGVSLRELAEQCGLSVNHFSRAFKQSTGLAPHQWLIRRRVEVATAVLSNPHISLAEVALICGFADQSHLTRVFSHIMGTSPGAWRRTYGINGDDISA
jgi:AraC-like DNA-binding protein